jgi:hypothetical protein
LAVAASKTSAVPRNNPAVGLPAGPIESPASLALTGSDTVSMMLLALLAIMLGGLVLLLSKPGRGGKSSTG